MLTAGRWMLATPPQGRLKAAPTYQAAIAPSGRLKAVPTDYWQLATEVP